MHLNAITDIRNVLSKEEFEAFDKTFWDFPEETIESLKKAHPEILLVNENTPSVCNLDGEDYETPSGVVAVVELKAVICAQKFHIGKTVLFPGKIEDISFDEHPSGFCELRIIVDKGLNKVLELLVTEYENGIPGGV